MKMRIKTILTGTVIVAGIFLAGNALLGKKLAIPEDVQAAMQSLPDELDYNIHVKRILSDKCFSCHGPDAAKQKGDLRLDVAEAAYAKKAESGLVAIRPGSLSKSEIAHRILSEDKDYLMPTPSSHLVLTTEEKAILLKWVEQGAEYKPHWAFVTPEQPKLPKVQQAAWVRNEIDNFVLSRLEKEGITPSKEADKETLIRRVSFDLTGLPPSMAEINAFVNDNSPNAYEKMVDQYLQSPHYGERMAAYWLDVARFADSHGYLDDKHRDASPWRDWVISAYNRNLPFDQFITWQLAGDLLPNATQEQILATGFNRNQKQNSEAGILPEEFRVEYVVDRTNTLGTAVLGLTVSCAKCHDHKYDPISQKDYFSLYAFFNSTFELGSSNYGSPDNIVPGPTLLLTTQQQEAQIKALNKFIGDLELNKKQTAAAAPERTLSDKVISSLSFDKVESLPIPVRERKKVKPNSTGVTSKPGYYVETAGVNVKPAFRNAVQPGLPAAVAYQQLAPGKHGQALLLGEETKAFLPPYEVGYFERFEPFAFSCWINVPHKYEESAILHHSDPRRYGFQGYDLLLKNNQLNFRLMHAFPHDAISVLSSQLLDSNKWHHIAVSYDGSSSAKGVQLYIDGQPAQTVIEYDNLKKNIRSVPNIHKIVPFTGVTFGSRELERTMKGAQLDEFYLFNNTLDAGEVAWLYQQVNPVFPVRKQQALTPDPLQTARMQLATLYDSTKEAMVMGDLPKPRPTHVLLRGVYDSYGDAVQPSTPESILPWPKDLPRNRLGLAQWLFKKEHPLTGRIAVNRLWEMFYGRGLVKTSDDFGNQGEMPSHPELLDFLAIKYREDKWDTKAMQKFILMSATYRQHSAIRPGLQEKDPGNILLARSSRYRMPAEMIRDNALSIAELLSARMGGPSSYPYQPAGLWDALSDKSWRYQYRTDVGEDAFRRSVYTIVKRSSPPPFMLIFDAPDRNFCTVKRSVSSSPLQALALLNDPTFIEAAAFVALRMRQEGGATEKDQLAYGFRLVTGRQPNTEESALLHKMYTAELEGFKKNPARVSKLLVTGTIGIPAKDQTAETAARASVVMALMNTDEFVTRK
ncbi:MAG: DUF1549 domain-containing protein [Candidatus Pseudobacter hemicellulosilyticus]|uniref:DUF1549 domain-containing protein n=1 Tax=Candidatus Pseudobacter hemicellulosilyticus TaxID=3121375 RepID=A0AAJ5WWQ8_9BACT|nr:MAG: DUF1549 domain-containing protein [Pseudobacter sp.]